MDKSRKTKWEKQMKARMIVLIIVLPVLFGLVIWAAAKFSHVGP